MICVVYGAKGGVGATTLACALATRGDAALVDLDLMNGDVYSALGLDAMTTLADVIGELDGLGSEALRRRLPRHASGSYALSQAGRVDQLDDVAWPRVATLLQRLERELGTVVVDGVRDLGDVALSAVDSATTIALVTTPELAAVRATRRARLLLRQIGVGDDRLALVVNRMRRRATVPLPAIVEAVELPPLALVGDGRAPRQKDLDKLAERLSERPRATLPPAKTARRWRIFRRAEET
jgi:Flp pilus assembly CpaE family ATPase